MLATSFPFEDQAMPLREHLTNATRDNILKGEYVDIFQLLFREIEKKDKEDLSDKDKECLKRCTVDRNWVNWHPGFLIYAGVIVQYQSGRALSLLQYMDIIYKGYTDFTGPAWIQYNAAFHMRAAMNPALCWDQIHPYLWMQIMSPAQPSRGKLSDSGHTIHCKFPLEANLVFISGAEGQGVRKTVIICGCSMIFWAAHQAKGTPIGSQLGLRERTSIKWLRRCGM